MQNVSNEYKKSMQNALRERAYIKIDFGLINYEIQDKANIESESFATYSKLDQIFTLPQEKQNYATFEQDFTKVDGTMFFPSRRTIIQKVPGTYYNTGMISDNLISEEIFGVTINCNIKDKDINFRGLTIEFGENYPLDFDIASNNGQVINVRNNKSQNFVTEEVFYKSSQIKIKFYSILNWHARLHIHSIIFGYGLSYTNDNVITSKLDSYISPIGENITQIDFTVTLDNYNNYFNIDNPRSAINFFETNQIMNISYGYQLPDSKSIEWITGNRLLCSEWEADNVTATIRCHDVFRDMNKEYVSGSYYENGISCYNLAEDVLKDAGIANYSIDESLKTMFIKNPMPRVPCKQALQIIANACRCVMMQSRKGDVIIQKNFDQSENDFIMAKNDMMSFPKTIKQEEIKEIKVAYYSYHKQKTNNPNREIIVNEKFNKSQNDLLTFYCDHAFYDFEAKLYPPDDTDSNNQGKSIQIEASKAYYVTVRFPNTGEFRLEISALRYNIVEQYKITKLKDKGKTITWDNPLISDLETATEIANLLKDYYLNGIEYEYNTRGNPELDVNDIIYQANDFCKNIPVIICKETLNFNQSFSGNVTTRRIREIKNVEKTEN